MVLRMSDVHTVQYLVDNDDDDDDASLATL